MDKADKAPTLVVEAPESSPESDSEETNTKRVGRPSKAEIAAKKPGGRKKRGRPPGETAIMNEYKARFLASPQSRKVIQKVFDTAMEDGHPHQGVCMKMVMDRVLPAKSFDEAKEQGGAKIEVNFIGMDAPKSVDVVDGEYEEVGGDDDYE